MSMSCKSKIIQGHPVLLENDVAELLRLTVAQLRQVIFVDQARFPDDFLVMLSDEEQRLFATKQKYAFTAEGMLMLATLINDEFAVNFFREYTKKVDMLDLFT